MVVFYEASLLGFMVLFGPVHFLYGAATYKVVSTITRIGKSGNPALTVALLWFPVICCFRGFVQ